MDSLKTDCDACKLYIGCKNPWIVPTGPVNSEILFIGGVPGPDEDRSGKPLHGEPAKMFKNIMARAGIDPNSVRYDNILQCAITEKKQKPTKAQIQACLPHIDFGKAKIIVPLGGDAFKAVWGQGAITKVRGKVFEADGGRYVVPMLDPSHVWRNRHLEPLMDMDFQVIISLLKGTESKYGKYEVLTDPEKVLDFFRKFEAADLNCLDAETNGLDISQLTVINASYEAGTGYVIPVNHSEHVMERNLLDIVGKYIVRSLKCPRRVKVFHNAKYDVKVFNTVFGAELKYPFEDTIATAHLIDENRGTHGLDYQAARYTALGGYSEPLENWRKKNLSVADEFNSALWPLSLLAQYGGGDVDAPLRLLPIHKKILSDMAITERRDPFNVYEEVYKPAIITAIDMELRGMQIDLPYVKGLIEDPIDGYAIRLDSMMADILDLPVVKEYSEEKKKQFNPRSPKQLGEILFGKLSLEPTHLTATNKPSTDEKALGILKNFHELPQLIVNYREVNKEYGTYIKPVPERLDARNIIHGNFNLNGTTTGRASSDDPNLQNIPKKYIVKRMFISRFPGGKLVMADESQVELRVLAAGCYSNCAALRRAFETGEDPHTTTARVLFPDDEITKSSWQRKVAKTFNFAVLYGRGLTEIRGDLCEIFKRNVPREEAQDFMDRYFEKLHEVKLFIDVTKNELYQNGFVTSAWGRARHLPNVYAIGKEGKELVAKAYRQAVNFKIQSSASDITMWALSRVDRFLVENNYKSMVVLTVHDSIGVDCVPEEVEDVKEILRHYMLNPPTQSWLDVELGVDVEVLSNWGEGEEDAPAQCHVCPLIIPGNLMKKHLEIHG